jgi:thiamine-monophosphate kinase
VEGVHWDPQEARPEQIGAKAVNRNLSDMAAMGLEPRWLLVSAAIPAGTSESVLHEIVLSMQAAAGRFNASLVGGDTSRSPGPLVLDVAVIGPLGSCQPVTRSGAKPGDRILVTGEFGGSALGKHLDFTPRVREGVFLNQHYRPSAMIDVSDGLERDLCRILDASQVGAILEGSCIPVAEAATRLAQRTGKDAIEHALRDGEDFELLFTLSPERARSLLAAADRFFSVTDVGEIGADRARLLRWEGREIPLQGEGFDHQF